MVAGAGFGLVVARKRPLVLVRGGLDLTELSIYQLSPFQMRLGLFLCLSLLNRDGLSIGESTLLGTYYD